MLWYRRIFWCGVGKIPRELLIWFMLDFNLLRIVAFLFQVLTILLPSGIDRFWVNVQRKEGEACFTFSECALFEPHDQMHRVYLLSIIESNNTINKAGVSRNRGEQVPSTCATVQSYSTRICGHVWASLRFLFKDYVKEFWQFWLFDIWKSSVPACPHRLGLSAVLIPQIVFVKESVAAAPSSKHALDRACNQGQKPMVPRFCQYCSDPWVRFLFW